MNLKNALIGILILCLVLTMGVSYLTGLGEEYGTSINMSGLGNSEETLKEHISNTEQVYNKSQNVVMDSSAGSFMMPYNMITTAWSSITLIFGSINLLIGLIPNMIVGGLGGIGIMIPGIVVSTIIAIIWISIFILLIEMFIRWKLE